MIRISKSGIRKHYLRHNMEHQFWAYESGNVIAAIAGSGGFLAFKDGLSKTFFNAAQSLDEKFVTLLSDYPDIFVALGIGAVTTIGPFLKIRSKPGSWRTNGADIITTVVATGILTLSIENDASLISTSAAAFILGSSFLRFSGNNPFFLKLGGLGLTAGGALLTAFGAENALQQIQNEHIDYARLNLDALTVGTGAYVSMAGLLTYEGGIFATNDYEDKSPQGLQKGPFDRLVHPKSGTLSKFFKQAADKHIQFINRVSKAGPLAFIPKDIRDTKPFKTSMWARLPWRAATGVFAAGAAAITAPDQAGFYAAFAAACGCWGYGDVMVGLEDDKRAAVPEPA